MKDKSIFQYQIEPKIQVIAVLATILVTACISKLVGLIGFLGKDPSATWIIACAFTLLYAVFNSIFSLTAENRNEYWGQSIIGFVVIMFGGGLIAYLFTGLSPDEAGSFRIIYMIFTFGYLLLLVITRSMRKIITIVDREDERLRGGDGS